MTFAEIETALGQRLEAIVSYPIAWPNKDFTPALPYVEFVHAPTTRNDGDGKGGYPIQNGICLLTVVCERDGFSNEALGIAQSIADGFPKSLRLTAGSGKVAINAAASLGSSFIDDGGNYRQPVRISYLTEG